MDMYDIYYCSDEEPVADSSNKSMKNSLLLDEYTTYMQRSSSGIYDEEHQNLYFDRAMELRKRILDAMNRVG